MTQSEEASSRLLGSAPLDEWLRQRNAASTVELAHFFEEFRPYLLTIARAELRGGLGQKLGGSDLVQETVIKGLKNFDQFKGSTREELGGWLRAILINLLLNYRQNFACGKRDLSREVSLGRHSIESLQESPCDEVLRIEAKMVLEKAMSQLPREYQLALQLRHRDNLSFAEIGRRMQKSEEAARKTWTRAVEQLKLESNRYESRKSE